MYVSESGQFFNLNSVPEHAKQHGIANSIVTFG